MLLLSLLACDPELPQAAAEPTVLEEAPGSPLVEQLYAEPEGELQDRVRLLIWLRSAELSEEELRRLRELRLAVVSHHAVARLERERAAQEAALEVGVAPCEECVEVVGPRLVGGGALERSVNPRPEQAGQALAVLRARAGPG